MGSDLDVPLSNKELKFLAQGGCIHRGNLFIYHNEGHASEENVLRCEAVVWFGPGHQSKRNCELLVAHEEHYVSFDNSHDVTWTGNETSSDYRYW